MNWEDVWIVIRAVKGKREQCLSALLKQIETFQRGYDVSYHGIGRSMAQSYCDCLSLATKSGRTWCLQLEDDAILRPDFSLHAARLIDDANGLGFLSFYSGKRGVSRDHPQMEILAGSRFLMAQAYAIKTELIDDHNQHVLKFCKDRPNATDPGTADWLKSRKMKYGRVWPSLVQHSDVVSLYGHHRNPNRFAESFSDGH